MGIGRYSRLWYLTAVVIALAGGAGGGGVELAAQGGGKSETSPPAARRSRVEPAKSVLRGLVGTWRFEVWFAGNFDGVPDASGTRVVRALFDDLRVEWTEELEGSGVRIQGVIGYDERRDRFFSTAVSSAGSAPELMVGAMDDAEPRITFSPIEPAPEAQSSVLSMLDANHFTWAALDRAWRAVFTRQP